MDEEQILTHARKYLEDDGYQTYDFEAVMHAEGTNVWTVIAKIPEGKIELLIDDNDGKLLQKFRHLVVVVNETVEYKENVSIAGTFYFELKEKLYLGGALINGNNIELVADEENKDYLKAFIISVPDFSEKTANNAFETANRLTNYLSFLTGVTVEHKRPIITEIKPDKSTRTISFTMDAILAKIQDLDLSSISDFLNKDDRIHQHLYQFKEGIAAIKNNDFAQAIRWLYMIIENNGSADSDKYKPLRNVISHEELDKDYTIAGVKIFGINLNIGDHLNFNDPEIQKILKKESINLLSIVRPIVEKEITNNTN